MNPSLHYRFWRVIVRALARAYWDLRIYNVERVPSSGPVILAANHTSFADPPLVGVGIRRATYFLARDTLFHPPLFGTWLRSVNSIPVDRDGGGAAGLRVVLDLLEQEEMVLLFPEGTRSANGNLLPARPGLGLIALKSGAPVVPVRLFGLFETWGRHQPFPRPGRVAIKYGMPLRFNDSPESESIPPGLSGKAKSQWVAERIMQAIGNLKPCQDLTSFPPPSRGDTP